MAATAKVIKLEGDPKKPESAQHIIIFPGGSIEVTRTSNNEYWAHIEVHKDNSQNVIIEECHRESAFGEIVDSRLDYDYPNNKIGDIPELSKLNHLAVRIRIKS